MARVFICYRRADSRWVAGRIYDRLVEVLDRENVFLDVSNIEPGEDFIDEIRKIISTCDILLALIGPGWSTLTDSRGQKRLDSADDLVRIEIATALRRDIRVIPILVDAAEMPEAAKLPDDLKSLARRNAKEVSFNRFHADLDSLIRVLQSLLKSSANIRNDTVEPSLAAAAPAVDKLPMTICLETLGGVATPLIEKGAALPATESVTFSTAEDNQVAVTINLVWGESAQVADNLSLGRFDLSHIPPAPKGVPQIEVVASVDQALILTVTARDQGTGRTEVLDSVDLSQIEIPESMRSDLEQRIEIPESPRDSKFGDAFADVFGDIFGDSALNVTEIVTISKKEARKGTHVQIKNGAGRSIRCKIPSGTTSGTKLRLRGQGTTKDGSSGDLFLTVMVK